MAVSRLSLQKKIKQRDKKKTGISYDERPGGEKRTSDDVSRKNIYRNRKNSGA